MVHLDWLCLAQRLSLHFAHLARERQLGINITLFIPAYRHALACFLRMNALCFRLTHKTLLLCCTSALTSSSKKSMLFKAVSHHHHQQLSQASTQSRLCRAPITTNAEELPIPWVPYDHALSSKAQLCTKGMYFLSPKSLALGDHVPHDHPLYSSSESGDYILYVH